MGVILVADAVYIASMALRSEHTVMAKCPAIVSASSSCDLLLVFNSSLTGVRYIALLVGSILNG